METTRWAKLNQLAHPPIRSSKGAAGMDLSSTYRYVLQPGERQLINTEIQVILPLGSYGRVAPRSGLSSKFGIETGAGVIDRGLLRYLLHYYIRLPQFLFIDYLGAVKVLLYNFSQQEFVVEAGDRIAQLIITKIVESQLEEMEFAVDPATTIRGVRAFGSTGK
jgi:dUTPase